MVSSVLMFFWKMVTMKRQCEREERSFMRVAATARLLWPASCTHFISSEFVTYTSVASWIQMPRPRSTFTCRLFFRGSSRSWIFSR